MLVGLEVALRGRLPKVCLNGALASRLCFDAFLFTSVFFIHKLLLALTV